MVAVFSRVLLPQYFFERRTWPMLGETPHTARCQGVEWMRPRTNKCLGTRSGEELMHLKKKKKSTPGNKLVLRGVLESHKAPGHDSWIWRRKKCAITKQTQKQANQNISFGVSKVHAWILRPLSRRSCVALGKLLNLPSVFLFANGDNDTHLALLWQIHGHIARNISSP